CTTTNRRGDQRPQSVGWGCEQEASETPPNTDNPDVQSLAKPKMSSLDCVVVDAKSGRALFFFILPTPKCFPSIFLRIPGKLEGHSCRLLLDLCAAKSLVNAQAFPHLRCKLRTGPSSRKVLSAEERKMVVKWGDVVECGDGEETWTVQFIMFLVGISLGRATRC
ncbi:unnamed protein product, partial [Taenia asiatica]|uniref:DUF5727 domain-containing protein n=1 Tax=Taenia asiatica TaxID=60517 RepID=A0A0R3VZA7_TAEAS